MAKRLGVRNKALSKWLSEQPPPHNTQTWLARRLRVRVSTVNELLHGKKAPSLHMALRVEDVTGIPPRAFEEVA